MAPYCTIPRDYLSDTPLWRAMVFLVSQHGQFNWVRYPLPIFWAFPLWRVCEVEVQYPSPTKGISAILARYPVKARQTHAISPSAMLSRKGLARYGGVSRIGPLRLRNAHLFIILSVRIFWRVCSQFWLSVRNSVWGPSKRNSRGLEQSLILLVGRGGC